MNTSTVNNFYTQDGCKKHLAEIIDQKLQFKNAMGENTLKDALHRFRKDLFQITIRTMADENPQELQDFMQGVSIILDGLDDLAKEYEKL